MGRIDRYLDGDLDRAALTPEERAKAEQIEALMDAARAYVTARPEPDVTSRVMSRVRAAQPSPAPGWGAALMRLGASLWTARKISFHVRPAYLLLAAALMVSGVVQWGYLHPRRVPAELEAGPPAPEVLVQFRLEAPAAASVRLAGSFTNWEPKYELHQAAPGVWTVTLPVPLGVHDYAFVVDGNRWLADPYAPQVNDGFGGTNSRLALLLVGGPQM
jgi:hypothetical protein